jgi:hypothetical protein
MIRCLKLVIKAIEKSTKVYFLCFLVCVYTWVKGQYNIICSVLLLLSLCYFYALHVKCLALFYCRVSFMHYNLHVKCFALSQTVEP